MARRFYAWLLCLLLAAVCSPSRAWATIPRLDDVELASQSPSLLRQQLPAEGSKTPFPGPFDGPNETVGSDRLIRMSHTGEFGGFAAPRYYHFDALGSVTALSDINGNVPTRLHLDAWGVFKNPSELNTNNRFAFTGYVYSPLLNLYYAKARFYDPETARFTSQDSYLGKIDSPPSLHRYFYANNNPTRYIDITGHGVKEAWTYGWHYGFSAGYAALHDLVPGSEFVGGRPEEVVEYLGGDEASYTGATHGHAAALAWSGVEIAVSAKLLAAAAWTAGGGAAGLTIPVLGEIEIVPAETTAAALAVAGVSHGAYGGYLMNKSQRAWDRLEQSLAKHQDANKPTVATENAAQDSKTTTPQPASGAAETKANTSNPPVGTDPPGTVRGANGKLRDAKTNQFVKDPNKPPVENPWNDNMRRKEWKKLVEDPSSGLTDAERQQIRDRNYRGPQRENPDTGEIETMELSHEPQSRAEGGTQVTPRWPSGPEGHAAVDPNRYLKGQTKADKIKAGLIKETPVQTTPAPPPPVDPQPES